MNRAFQIIWFLIRPAIPTIGKGRLDRQYYRMLIQIRLAMLFKLHRVILGDSNAAGFEKLSLMKRWIKTTADIALGGTTAFDWFLFLNTKKGRKIYSLVRDLECIWSIGGNHILLDQMVSAEGSLTKLHVMFPQSWILNIPPIYDFVLSGIGNMPASYYHEGNLTINMYIMKLWKDRVIDIYTALIDENGNSKVGMLRDMVHYSNLCMKILIELVDEI